MKLALARAQDTLAARRLVLPASRANQVRNARAELGRRRRWTPARDEAWSALDDWIRPDARVAIVGAGNGDTLPLDQIADRACRLALIDIDATALGRARGRLPRRSRGRVEAIVHDITDGCADQLATQVATGSVPSPPRLTESPLPGSPYDVVIGDLFYSQLLYPAFVELQIPDARRAEVLDRHGPELTRGVVARMHVSAPRGHVAHLHDPAGWWPGHSQPLTLARVLRGAERDVDEGLALAAQTNGPHDSDPRPTLRRLGIPIRATRWWRWPFAADVDYLVCATIAGAPRART